MFITRKKHEKAIAEMEARLTQSLDFNQTFLEKKLEELVSSNIEKLKVETQTLFEAAIAADRLKRYGSNEPYVEIISETFSEEGGVQLRLDWNAPFISYLKKNGFTGASDEAIVDNWLVSLSRERIAEGGSEYK